MSFNEVRLEMVNSNIFVHVTCDTGFYSLNFYRTPLVSDHDNTSSYSAWNYYKLVFVAGMLKCVLGWCLPLDYQKLESPTPDRAVHVDINVEILDILSVNDKEFSMTMSMYFSVMWQENRIETNNTIEPDFWYPVSLEFLRDLWIPNVFIYNLKSFENISVLKRLAGRPFLRLSISDSCRILFLFE